MSKYTSSIIITGGTQGLGYQCALHLAAQCSSTLIVLAARSDASHASASINTKLAQSNTTFMSLDLSTLAAVRTFATTWSAAYHPPIQSLVLNAGIQFPGAIAYSPDGFEASFATNHVGHVLLFHLLIPFLTPSARIVVVSSGVHDPARKWGLVPAYTSAESVAHPSAAAIKQSSGRDRYATSKVANVLWTRALGRRFASSPNHEGKTAIAFDPGLMFPTNLARNASWLVRFLGEHVAWRMIPLLKLMVSENINSPAESGGNLAWLAVGEEVEGLKGVYFEKRKEREVSEVAGTEEVQEELWRWTVENVACGEEERRRFEMME